MLLMQMAAELESVFTELESVNTIYTSAKTGYGLPFNNRLKYASGTRSASDGNDLSEMVLELYCALDSDISEPTASTAHQISNTPARSTDCTHADPGSRIDERDEATKAQAARIHHAAMHLKTCSLRKGQCKCKCLQCRLSWERQ